MRAESCRIVLRPRGVLETFDLVVVFLRANAGEFMRLLAMTALPVIVLLGGLAWLAGGHPLLLLAPLPFLGIVQLPFTSLAGRLLFSEDADSWTQGVRGVTSRAVLLLLVARGLLVVGTFMTLGLAVFLAPGLHFLPEILLLERVEPGRALSRGMRLGSTSPSAPSRASSVGGPSPFGVRS